MVSRTGRRASLTRAQRQLAAYQNRKLTITSVAKVSTQTPQQLAAAIQTMKRDKHQQRKWAIKSKIQATFGFKLSSSFVNYLRFETNNDGTGTANVTLGERNYHYWNVPEAIFVAWTKGAATCQTSDSGHVKEWWLGKTPSLGAFFNHYIKNKYSWGYGWV